MFLRFCHAKATPSLKSILVRGSEVRILLLVIAHERLKFALELKMNCPVLNIV